MQHTLYTVCGVVTSPSSDLTDPATFRDLSKPVGALNSERLEFFKVTCGCEGSMWLCEGVLCVGKDEDVV